MSPLYTLKIGEAWNSYKSEKLSFQALLLYFFFEYVRPQNMYPSLQIIPWAQLILIVTILAYCLEKKTKLPSSPISFYLGLLAVHVGLSSMYMYAPEFGLSKLDIFYSWIVVYFLMIKIINTPNRLFLFLLLYILVNFKMSQHGFTSWALRGFAFTSWGVSGSGWFQNSGEFGMQMCTFLPIIVFFNLSLQHHWGKWLKRVMWFVPFTVVATIVASSSRGAVIGLVIMLAIMILKSHYKIRAFLLGATIIVLGYFVMPAEFISRFTTAGEDSTSMTRLEYWKNGIDIMDTNPVFGVGYMNWQIYYRDFYFDETLRHKVEAAHNTFIEFGAELGYVGLSIFVLAILHCLRINKISQKLTKDRPDTLYYNLARAQGYSWIGLIVPGCFLSAHLMPSFWIQMAITVIFHNVIKVTIEKEKLSPS